MPNVFQRVGLAATALFRSPAATAAALRKVNTGHQATLVGAFPADTSPLVGAFLGGVMPGSRGEPPPRGRANYLLAYSTMPWLRAVSDRVAWGVAAVPWQVLAIKGKGGKFVRDAVLQRADGPTREKMLAHYKASGDLVEIVDHPLYELLHGGNDMMTGGTVRMLTVLYLDLVGEGFFIKQRNGAGAPVGLWPLAPNWVAATPTPQRRKYDLQVEGWRDAVDDTEVLWLKRADPANPYARGTGIAQSLADELETDEYTAKMIKSRMWNRAAPDVLIAPKDPKAELKKEQVDRMEQSWLQKVRGLWRQGGTLFSPRAVEVQTITPTFRELQLVELRQHERDVIVQVYGIPPEKLGILTNSNRATIEGADLIFAKDLIVPRCEFLREHYQERLAPEYDERLIVHYVSPVAEDQDRQLEAGKTAPWSRMANEWRRSQGLEEDPRLGKGYFMPIGMRFVADPAEDEGGVDPSIGTGSDAEDEDQDEDEKAALADDATVIAKVARASARPAVFRTGTYSAKAIALDDDYYTLVHRVADKLAPKLRRQFMQTIAKIQDATLLTQLENAFASGQLAAAEAAIPWAQLEAQLNGGTAIIRQALYAAGEAAAAELSDVLGVALKFDRTNPAAEAWAAANAARYVVEITEHTRAALRELIADAYAQQMTAQELARLVRPSIGLDSRRAAAVLKFRNRLVAEGIDGDQLEARVAKYAAAKLKQRSAVIAEHELLTASSMGQRHLWRQALAKGHLADDITRRRWLNTGDDRLCEDACEAGPHHPDNQDVKINGQFTSPRDGRKFDGMPEHVKCRCAEGLEFTT